MAVQQATPIVLTAEERATLAGWVRSARRSIAWWSGPGSCCSPAGQPSDRSGGRVRTGAWSADGGRGSPKTVWPGSPTRRARANRRPTAPAADRRILALLDRPPPAGFARWTAPLLAQELGDISDQHVWRFLRAQRIDLALLHGGQHRCSDPPPGPTCWARY